MSSKITPDTKWIENFRKSIRKFVLRGDYQSALQISKKALKDYPDSFDCRFQYAKLLGDWADELPPARKKKYKKEAISILRPLTRALSGKPADQRFGVCLNLYYQSEAYLQMYQFGKRLARRHERSGFYAQGLGACLLAKDYYASEKRAQAKRWASRSIRAWEEYGLENEKYYFAHYSLATSLALNDQPTDAMKRLKLAAKLSRRKVTDWEFADTLEIISTSS